jgi:formate hydrogenlyase subunit 6/NADH:ubiquinone oxidoreductase subunit I
MKFGTMLRDVVQALFSRPATELYPVARTEEPERLRSLLHWNGEGCTGCSLCCTDCPADAIELITLDRKAKQFVLRYHVDRCTFCGQCVENCRFNCIQLSNDEWELASAGKGPFTIYYGEDANVQRVLADELSDDKEEAEPAAKPQPAAQPA